MKRLTLILGLASVVLSVTACSNGSPRDNTVATPIPTGYVSWMPQYERPVEHCTLSLPDGIFESGVIVKALAPNCPEISQLLARITNYYWRTGVVGVATDPATNGFGPETLICSMVGGNTIILSVYTAGYSSAANEICAYLQRAGWPSSG
jgi:hypothetical protein